MEITCLHMHYSYDECFGRARPSSAATLSRLTKAAAEHVFWRGIQVHAALSSTGLGEIHADETPVQMLAPAENRTHRAYIWAYSTMPLSALKAVGYDFSPSRAGEHARNFLRA